MPASVFRFLELGNISEENFENLDLISTGVCGDVQFFNWSQKLIFFTPIASDMLTSFMRTQSGLGKLVIRGLNNNTKEMIKTVDQIIMNKLIEKLNVTRYNGMWKENVTGIRIVVEENVVIESQFPLHDPSLECIFQEKTFSGRFAFSVRSVWKNEEQDVCGITFKLEKIILDSPPIALNSLIPF